MTCFVFRANRDAASRRHARLNQLPLALLLPAVAASAHGVRGVSW